MNDWHIRTILKQKLAKQYANDPHTSIIEELGLCHGEARIDLAVVNGSLHGYELKSDKDNLERLPNQARIYDSIFDRITLIVSSRHVYEAIKIISEWWGIKIAEKGHRGSIRLITIRKSRNNPTLDPRAIIELLWRDEAISFLDELASANGVRSKPKRIIYNKLLEVADLNTIRSKVRDRLKNRINWRAGSQQMLNGD